MAETKERVYAMDGKASENVTRRIYKSEHGR
jgi:hypothetical protein